MIDVDAPYIDNQEERVLISCIRQGSIGQGCYVAKFEKKFSAYCRMRFGCATTSGTTALHLALKVLDIKQGDEVLVPSLTFIASVSPVSFCGAKPVFVDCDPKTWCLDPNDLQNKITSKSKAVIPVHLYGNACDMGRIGRIASRHNLKIIEDCAEAHGTVYKGKQVGSFSDISFYSFYKNKHITTGEGGMCLTNSSLLNEKLRTLRSHGKKRADNLSDEDFANKQFISSQIGFNYRMTDLQAAIGLVQLRRIKMSIAKRISYANLYRRLLKKVPVILPYCDSESTQHSYWFFPLLVNTAKLRTKVMISFRKRGIRLRPFFYPCHWQPFYQRYKSYCPVSEDVSQRGILLPINPALKKENIVNIAVLLSDILKGESSYE